MKIPETIQILIQRLEHELEETQREATRGISLLQPALSLFSGNPTILRYFVYFNNALLLVDNFRKRIESIKETFVFDEITDEQIQEAGQELGELLGRVLEAKIEADRILKILED
jgi:hypothetical protein